MCVLLTFTLAMHVSLFLILVITNKSWVSFFTLKINAFRTSLDIGLISQILYVIRSLFDMFGFSIVATIIDFVIAVAVNYIVVLLFLTVRKEVLGYGSV